MTAQMVYHTLEPVYDRNSRILILGTMPSPKSREFGFYYSHPQNKLWKVISQLFQEPAPESNEAKERFLQRERRLRIYTLSYAIRIQDGHRFTCRPLARPIAEIMTLNHWLKHTESF